MAVLKNARHEIFAQAIAAGESTEEAFRKAGYKANRGNAGTLKANQVIRDRVAVIQAGAAAIAEFTAADAVRQADEDRAFARDLQQPSAAVSASTLKFKLLGLLVEKAQVEYSERPEVTHEPIDARIARLTADAEANGHPIH